MKSKDKESRAAEGSEKGWPGISAIAAPWRSGLQRLLVMDSGVAGSRGAGEGGGVRAATRGLIDGARR